MTTFGYSIFVFAFINTVGISGYLPTGGWKSDLLLILGFVPMFTLIPRFIMSIRELYAHDVQGRRGEGIDTGFGLSLPCCDVGGMFADVEQNEGSDGVEEKPMEVETTQPDGTRLKRSYTSPASNILVHILKSNVYRFGDSYIAAPIFRDVDGTIQEGQDWAVIGHGSN
ncbi:hypothetical protein OG21DRAFT_1502058 [Imleria badia]|nr:hypothetical protein OG21DRAFT_1502058 [Imleria badia]